MSQKITPFLWFNNDQAEEAIQFYLSIFSNSKMISTNRAGPDGKLFTAIFQLEDLELAALNNMSDEERHQFQFTPSISFFVTCDDDTEINVLWNKLSQENDNKGILMPLSDTYPFCSEHQKFGWLQDKYGLSWQLIQRSSSDSTSTSSQKIMPFFLYGGETKKAQDAMTLYTSLFAKESRILHMEHFGEGEGGGVVVGAVKLATFVLHKGGHEHFFRAMDGGPGHAFGFTEAISLSVTCTSQEEVDDLWQRLTADGGTASQCGWLKDKFGVSWQIIPSVLMELLSDKDPEKAKRVQQAMLQMQKIDISALEQARDGCSVSGEGN